MLSQFLLPEGSGDMGMEPQPQTVILWQRSAHFLKQFNQPGILLWTVPEGGRI